MRFQVIVMGEKAIATKFERTGNYATDATPAFEDVADYLFQITDKTFSSQGRRGGGSWKGLTPRWRQFKARKGYDTRILHKFGTLRDSVTRRGAEGQILEITSSQLRFGTDLEYAARHQYGHFIGSTPKRPFIRVLKTDTVHIRNLIRDHLMQAWRART